MRGKRTSAKNQDFSDPIEAIKFYMDERGLKQRDLIPMIGSRSKVSEVLSGSRSLDDAHGPGSASALGHTS